MNTYLAQNWWILALRGLAAVIFGILAFLWPDITITVLVWFFGAYALWDGIFSLISAFRTKSDRRWALALTGVAGIVAGLLTIFWPGPVAFVLLLIIAAWAVITGVFEIIAAIRLREEIEGEWLLLVGGVLSVIFGVVMAVWPAAGLLAVTWIIGFYALLYGILLIALAFRLRGWNKEHLSLAAQ